ncbi:MAG: TatD family hydrolase [bacterium]|nr:TatD family hydrolase [bacterium]
MKLLVDAHAHLYLCDSPKSVVERAEKAGVEVIINNGVCPDSNKSVMELNSPIIKKALGMHPTECAKLSNEVIDDGFDFIKENKDKIVAVGEIGLDYYRDKNTEKQKEIFKKALKIAKELKKPVIVHSRKAEEDVFDILEHAETEKVILHCFDGSTELVKRGIANKWFFSVPTNIVKSSSMKKLASLVPTNQLLSETDAPFLSPFPEKRNEPMFVVEAVKKIAEIKEIEAEELVKIIYNNYQRLFS